MNGIIARAVAVAGLLGSVAGLVGCRDYKELVDPCYPDRYNWQAQETVCELLGTQINNGHILDQTVWNSHFETGKAKLTKGGQDYLDRLIRRRPHPDPVIYLATAHDITYIPDAPVEVYVQARRKLDLERIESIQKYLAAQTAGRNLSFQIYVHDPDQPYVGAAPMLGSMLGVTSTFKGTMGGGGGGAAGGGGAPTGGGGTP
jgi:hypothetical protein